MEYLTKVEVIKETGITIGQFRHYIDYNYFKNYKKEKGKWLISKEDVEMLKDDLQYMENSYLQKEVAELLGYANTTIPFQLDTYFKDNYKFIFQKFYIKKVAVHDFIKCNPEFSYIQSGEYISAGEIAKIIKRPTGSINHLIRTKKIIDVVRHPINRLWYIHKSEADNLIDTFTYADNAYTLKDLCSILGCECSNIKRYTKELCIAFQDYRLINKQYHFNKDPIDKKLAELPPDERILQNIILTKNTLRNIKKKISEQDLLSGLMKQGKKYISINTASEILNVNLQIVNRSINRGKFKDIIQENGQHWISEDEVRCVRKLFNESIEANNLPEDILSKNEIRNMFNQKLVIDYFPNAFQFDIYGIKTWRVPLNDLENFKSNRLIQIEKKRLIQQEQNPKKLYDLLITDYEKTTYKKTLSSYNEFALIKINSTNIRGIRNYVFTLVSSIGRLLNNITKEIYLYSDKELESFFLIPDLSTSDKLYISMYLKFCKNKFKEHCQFNNNYNRYVANIKDNMEDDIYSEEKWMDYFRYLTDIDRHIEMAFKNAKYSKIWLFTILHLSIAWRREDILNIPALTIDSIDDYSIDWFKNNLFTITHGQNIINDIKTLLSIKIAHKNGAKSHFLVYPVLIVPTSIAFIAAEHHRRKNNQIKLFATSKFFKSDYEKFFEPEHLRDFRNSTACRTLITHNFHNAVITEGMADLAYSLSTYLRSHKINTNSELAPTTSQYIYSTNSDGDANNVAYNLFKRGHFGWLYHTLIKLGLGDEDFTQEEMTYAIIQMKKDLAPIAVEELSAYIEYEYEERKAVIKELISTPKEEIKGKLFAISRGDMPSKIEHTQCLKSNNCPYRLNTNCTGCKYKIPTNYTLSIIKVELNTLIVKLENTEDVDYVSRQRYTIQIVRLLSVLREAKNEFDKWDKDYLKSFFNMNELQLRIEKLQRTKFIMLR